MWCQNLRERGKTSTAEEGTIWTTIFVGYYGRPGVDTARGIGHNTE